MQEIQSISVIVPVYNEQDNLKSLFSELKTHLEPLNLPWEVIFIDDGSIDASLQVIYELAQASSKVSYVIFEQNCGQSAAFGAGFAAAQGQLVVTIDADLQNDPADIKAMLEKYAQGYDMVIGWRAKRRDNYAKRLASKWANRIRNALTHDEAMDTGCSLKIMRTDMAKLLPVFKGMHRFFPALMKMEGAKIAQMQVNHRPRLYGESKYPTFGRAKTAFFDLLAVVWMQQRYIKYKIKEQKKAGL